jgi:hypothetical protein
MADLDRNDVCKVETGFFSRADNVSKQDALCLLKIYDDMKTVRMNKDEILGKAFAPGTPAGEAAALRRLSNHIDRVGHVAGTHYERGSDSILIAGDAVMAIPGSTQLVKDYVVTTVELNKLIK